MTSIATVTGNPWLVAASALSGGDKLILKHNKGDWLLGQEDEDVPQGTLIAVDMQNAEWGWLRWYDSKPADRRMHLISSGQAPEPRDALDHDDKELWERDPMTNEPRDPWQKTIEIPARELSGERREVLLSGSSRGWEGACKALFKQYGEGLAAGKGALTPIVKLGVSHYDHKNKAFGRIKVPVLELVEWREPGELLAAPPAKKTKF
jgi:hypothetical protein